MDQFTRRIIGFDVHAGDVDGVALCQMFNTAISTMGAPKYLSSDNDPLFRYHRWRANLRILEIVEIKSIPYTPVSHPFVDRLWCHKFGSIYATRLRKKHQGYGDTFFIDEVFIKIDGKQHYSMASCGSRWRSR